MIIEGIIAKANALYTTTGVYHLANLVIKFSVCDFFSDAFSTSSNILETVESSNAFVASIFNKPSPLMQPEITSSPILTVLGTDSPVKAAVFTKLSPLFTIPSTGIFSPGLMTRILPISTSSGSIISIVPSSFSRLACSGTISINCVIEARDLPTA